MLLAKCTFSKVDLQTPGNRQSARSTKQINNDVWIRQSTRSTAYFYELQNKIRTTSIRNRKQVNQLCQLTKIENEARTRQSARSTACFDGNWITWLTKSRMKQEHVKARGRPRTLTDPKTRQSTRSTAHFDGFKQMSWDSKQDSKKHVKPRGGPRTLTDSKGINIQQTQNQLLPQTPFVTL